MIPGSKQNHPTLLKSFAFAWQGFRIALREERNIRIMLAIGAAAIVCGFIVGLDLVSWALLMLCCGIVIGVELINTSIETIVDLVSPEYHPLAGRAKDIAAAAVYMTCIAVAIVGICIFVHAFLFR